MPTAVVLGGGVSGLAAAYYLHRLTTKFTKIILLESQSRLGGWVHTTKYPDGAKFEHGPRSFRPAGQSGVNTIDLVEELGLSDQVLVIPPSHHATKNRYVYVDGKCHALPSGISGILKTLSPFSKPWILSLAAEPFKSKSDEEDESIDSFVRRRLGTEIADYAINPMCRGIFAGNSKQLSVRSCLPPLYNFEKDDGSIVKGAVWPSKGRQRLERSTELSKRAKSESWSAWSLKEGAEQLTNALVSRSLQDKRVEIRANSSCLGLTPKDGKIQVKTDGDTIQADHVFSSLYSAVLSDLLPDQLSELKSSLSSIPAVTVAVVNIEYPDHVLPVKGFGHLLPSTEDEKLLGMVYDSCVFPEHDRQDQPSTRITVMMGGAWYDELVKEAKQDLSEEFLISLASKSAQDHLGISAMPTRTVAKIQKNCIPQYLVGHWKKVSTIFTLTEEAGLPISYLGSSYQGPSVNDCIYNSKQEVQRVVSRSFSC